MLNDIHATTDHARLMNLATRLDSLLLHCERGLINEVVGQIVASQPFRWCLSYATLWGLSERTVEILRVVTEAIGSSAESSSGVQ